MPVRRMKSYVRKPALNVFLEWQGVARGFLFLSVPAGAVEKIRQSCKSIAGAGYRHCCSMYSRKRVGCISVVDSDLQICGGDKTDSERPLKSLLDGESFDAAVHSVNATALVPRRARGTNYTMRYLADLVRERYMLSLFSMFFSNLRRLVDEEIDRVHAALFKDDLSIDTVDLPFPEGSPIIVTEKIYIPCDDYPEYNFVGRILGPRGMSSKLLENETGCKIMVRGRGSVRNTRRVESSRGKHGWDDKLHVLVQCKDAPNRAYLKLDACVQQIKKLLIPVPEKEDEFRRKQMMELAIFQGRFPLPKIFGSSKIPVSPLLQPLPLLFISSGSQGGTTAANMMSSVMLRNVENNALMSRLSSNTDLASLLPMGAFGRL